MFRAICTIVFGMLGVASVGLADEPLEVGVTAPTSIVAEFVTGKWAEHGTACPVLAHRDAMKIAVFVKRLDAPVLPLVSAIDRLVSEDDSLKWSFVFVSHENAPTPSDEEWKAQLDQLRSLSNDKKIVNLSLGVMLRNPDTGRPSKAKRELGFWGEGDVVVMLIRPDSKAKRGVIQHVDILKSDSIQQQTVDQIMTQLKDAVAVARSKGD